MVLGEVHTEYPTDYAPGVSNFDNKNPGNDAWTSFICTEFRSLPENKRLTSRESILIMADKKMVESVVETLPL